MDNATFRSFLQVLPPVEFACVYGSSLHPSNHDKVFLCFVPIINFCLLFLFSIQGLFFFFFHSPFSCCFNICSLFCVFGFLDNHDRLYSWRIWSKTVAFWGTDMWWCVVYLCYELHSIIIWPPHWWFSFFSFYSSCNGFNQESEIEQASLCVMDGAPWWREPGTCPIFLFLLFLVSHV